MIRVAIPLTVIALVVLGSVVLAQSGASRDLSWSTIDGGGTTSTGANYVLMGTIGQSDAGALTGGTYALVGGFWGSHARVRVYLPTVLRSYGP